MANLLEMWNNALRDHSDPRTKDWFMMSSIWPTVLLCIVYISGVWLGPKFMKNRAPYDLKRCILVYNFILICLCGYMTFEFLMTTVFNPRFSLLCQDMDYSEDPLSLRLSKACWWFYFSKPIELLDTAFFILRKKDRQVTFLHVYHHVTMPLLWWIGVRFVPGGEAYFTALMNSFVHVVMYSYYLLAALGPRVQPYLWWKRHLTKLQLAQFFAGLFHTVQAYVINCGYPRPYEVALIFYLFTQISLFMNFYFKTYRKPSDKRNGARSNGAVKNGDASNGAHHKLQ